MLDDSHTSRGRGSGRPSNEGTPLIEWRVLVLSFTLFLYSFGYGAITSFSAVYADALGISPKSIYLTTLAVVILLTRPLSGSLGDRIGYRRVFVPALALIACGLALLAVRGTRASFVASAIVFGLGFGTAYPAYRGVRDARRQRAPPRRRLRRDPRRVRHRHRHWLDDGGMVDSAVRFLHGVRHRRGAVGNRPPVSSAGRPSTLEAESSTQGHSRYNPIPALIGGFQS